MAEITAAMVKDFREKTGAAMMDAKKALVEANGDFAAAEKILKDKGVLKAQKKADRQTAEGLVCAVISADGKQGLLAEINCETDFVARNDQFVQMATGIANDILANPKINSEADIPEEMNNRVLEAVAKLGENMRIGKVTRLTLSSEGAIAQYIHGGGRIGVLLELNVTNAANKGKEELQALGRDLCMQIAALDPMSIGPEGLPQAFVDEQRELVKKQTIESGKPTNMIDKIVDGRMGKLYSEVCLLQMTYVKDENLTVEKHVAAVGKSIGDTITLGSFKRIRLGSE